MSYRMEASAALARNRRPAGGVGPQRGYVLVAVAIALSVAGLVVAAGHLDPARARLYRERNAAAAMQAARLALIGYAVSYRDLHEDENFGYLPCPDTSGSGTEKTPCGKAGTLAVGLLPYKTLGLPDLRDADGNCLWYAVSGSFKSSPKSVPFNWDTQGQIAVRSASGVPLALPEDAAGGAAAVVVAPGPVLASQRRGVSNGCGDPARMGAYLENVADAFIDGIVIGADGEAAANDRVVWITPKEIFDRIVNRSDFAAFMEDGVAAVRSALGKQAASAGNALPAKNPFGKQASHYNFYAGWKDQFRYLRCTSECFTGDEGAGHKAVLLFGGRSADGIPRPTGSRALSDYFESALSLAQGLEFEGCTAASARFDNASAASRAADMALCLGP